MSSLRSSLRGKYLFGKSLATSRFKIGSYWWYPYRFLHIWELKNPWLQFSITLHNWKFGTFFLKFIKTFNCNILNLTIIKYLEPNLGNGSIFSRSICLIFEITMFEVDAKLFFRLLGTPSLLHKKGSCACYPKHFAKVFF